MKWGKINNPERVDYTFPDDPDENIEILGGQPADHFNIYLGYAGLSKAKLKGFYPKGINDELTYYSRQFNAIEFNATFYKEFSKEQFTKWKNKTPQNFKFYPKLSRTISHVQKLKPETSTTIQSFLKGIQNFGENLGIPFLQLPETFHPANGYHLKRFVNNWPSNFPLAIELRHLDWYKEAVRDRLFELLQSNQIAHVITDTPGRRDLMHMRLTNKTAFIRYVAADQPIDENRLDEWIERLSLWKSLGLKEACFFIHQDVQNFNSFLATDFALKLNKHFKLDLPIPIPTNSNFNLFS